VVRVNWTEAGHLLFPFYSLTLAALCSIISTPRRVGTLNRRINSRRPRPTIAEAAKQVVIEKWDTLTVDDYKQRILPTPEDIRERFANERGHTIYNIAGTDSNLLFYSFEIGENQRCPP
jgi:hypothetical protein